MTWTYEDEFTTPGSSAQIWLVLQVDLVSQSIVNNQSTLNWYLRMEERVNASPFNNNATSDASATVNGVVYSASTLTYNFDGTNETIQIASGTTVVTHTADGSKTISIAASYDGGSPLGVASFSTTQVLPTIPRATVPSVSPTSGETGASYTITHSPASASFYHDVAYSLTGIGGSYTDIQTNIIGTDTSTGWTPAHTLLPNATGVTAYIRVITRSSSGGTIIGTEYVALPLTVPASVKPTVTSVAWADSQVAAPDMPTLMGGAGRYVQRWSKLTPTVTAAGAGGSTISSIQVTQNGQTTPSGTPFTNAIALSGSVPFSVVATDSRGRTNDAYASTVAVTAYNYPNFLTPTVTRTSDAGGLTPSPTGTFLKITPVASVSSLNFSGEKNLLEYQIRTRLSGGSWTTVQAWTATGVSGTTWTTPVVLSGYLSSAEYEVEVSVRDLFGKNGYDTGLTIKTLTVSVPSEAVDIDWNQGLGFGFNKYHSGSGAFVQIDGGLDVVGNIEADTITQAGLAVIDAGDLASDTVAGIQENATSAEVIAGVALGRTVTPAGLASLTSTATRRGLVELSTSAENRTGTDTDRAVTPAGLTTLLRGGTQGRTPSSVAVGSGSASVAEDGTVTFTAVSSVSLNDVFDGLGADIYEVVAVLNSSTGATVSTRLRSSGSDDSTASHVYAAHQTNLSAGPTRASSAVATSFGFWMPITSGVGAGIAGKLTLFRPAISTVTWFMLDAIGGANSDRQNWTERGNTPSSARTGFSIIASAGTITGWVKVIKIA